MKKICLSIGFCATAFCSFAQNSNPWPTTGNVGIGTTTPTSTLEIAAGAGSSANGIVISQGNSGGNVNSGRLFFSNAGDITTNSFGIYKNANVLQFTYAANPGLGSGTPGLVMTNTGNIGIGANSPASNLQIGATTGNSFITLAGGSAGASYGINYSFGSPGTFIYAQQMIDYDTRATRGMQFNTQSGYAFSFNTIGNTGVYGNNLLTILGSGKVGIGTSTPTTILDVSTSAAGNGIRSTSTAALSSTSGGGLLAITTITPTASDQRLGFLGFGSISTGTTYKYASSVSAFAAEAWDSAGNGSYLTLSTTPNRSANIAERMRIDNAGNVCIGTTTPATGYKLSVNGSAIATAMTVQLNANWPDYVFKTGYRLPALNEIKTYIDANHHLPEVPTEQEVKQNGLNLGEMNRVLLKKVEELTLYMIEKDKTEKEQKEINNSLLLLLKAQQAQIDQLKKQMKSTNKTD